MWEGKPNTHFEEVHYPKCLPNSFRKNPSSFLLSNLSSLPLRPCPSSSSFHCVHVVSPRRCPAATTVSGESAFACYCDLQSPLGLHSSCASVLSLPTIYLSVIPLFSYSYFCFRPLSHCCRMQIFFFLWRWYWWRQFVLVALLDFI